MRSNLLKQMDAGSRTDRTKKHYFKQRKLLTISKAVIDVIIKVGIEVLTLIGTLITRKSKKRRKDK